MPEGEALIHGVVVNFDKREIVALPGHRLTVSGGTTVEGGPPGRLASGVGAVQDRHNPFI